jgi:hypothetical protein
MYICILKLHFYYDGQNLKMYYLNYFFYHCWM